MDTVKQKNFNTAAQILLVILMINIAAQLSVYYQTKLVLYSPIIPEGTAFQVAESYIFNALVCSLGGVAALLFYFLKKPVVTCALALAAMGLGQSYFLFQ